MDATSNLEALSSLEAACQAIPAPQDQVPAAAQEDEVAQALYDLEVNNTSLRPVLQKLYLNTAKEIEVSPTLRAVVIFVPLRFLVKFHKIQKTLITELEKKFSGKQVFILAQRKIARKVAGARRINAPRCRTRVKVQENIMVDLLHPVEVVGRRWKHRVDGTVQTKVLLDAREKEKIEPKLESLAMVYKRLTGITVSFGFMSNPLLQQFL